MKVIDKIVQGMKNKSKYVRVLILCCMAAFSIVTITISVQHLIMKPSNCSTNTLASGSNTIGGEFELFDSNGILVNSREIISEPSLIYFGYSFCPDVCPYDLERNAIAIDILQDLGLSVTPIFITIDPERDTPERLRAFSPIIHPKLISLTGSKFAINETMKLFKVYGARSQPFNSDEENYLLDHSAFTYLIDPEKGFLEFYHRKVTSEEMANSIECLISTRG